MNSIISFEFIFSVTVTLGLSIMSDSYILIAKRNKYFVSFKNAHHGDYNGETADLSFVFFFFYKCSAQ